MAIFPPPDRLTGYHVDYLLAAERGELHYDTARYPIHGVPNNAIDALWRGLLADSAEGLVLTELGARMLAEWKASAEGRRWLTPAAGDRTDRARAEQDQEDARRAAPAAAPVRARAVEAPAAEQLAFDF